MKTCEVDLSESDVTRLALRFDEEESMRIDIQKFLKFIRGVTDGWIDRQIHRQTSIDIDHINHKTFFTRPVISPSRRISYFFLSLPSSISPSPIIFLPLLFISLKVNHTDRQTKRKKVLLSRTWILQKARGL